MAIDDDPSKIKIRFDPGPNKQEEHSYPLHVKKETNVFHYFYVQFLR